MPLVVKREGKYLADEHRDVWADAQLDAVWFRQSGKALRAAARHQGSEIVRLSNAGGLVGGFRTEAREARASEPIPPSRVGEIGIATTASPPKGLTLEDLLDAPVDELEQTEAKLEDLTERARVRAERQLAVERRAAELRAQLGMTTSVPAIHGVEIKAGRPIPTPASLAPSLDHAQTGDEASTPPQTGEG